MPIRSWFVCLFGLLLAAPISLVAQDKKTADPLDWPYARGPEMNGISREKNLPDSWTPEGQNLIWSKAELGTRSTPIVMNGKLYALVRHNPSTKYEDEKVVCADAATGEKKWENIFNVFLTDVPDTRVGWSSVVGDPATGNVSRTNGGACSRRQDGPLARVVPVAVVRVRAPPTP